MSSDPSTRTENIALSSSRAAREVKSELTLPSGVRAVIFRGKGKHQRDAGRMARIEVEGVMGFQLALIAQLVEFDGKSVTYEDVLEMDLEDIEAVQVAMGGKGVTGRNASSSLPSTSRS